MYQARHLSPIIPSYNLPRTVSFFLDQLGFQIGRAEETYYILYKDQATIHIQRAGVDIGEMAVYLEVDDLDPIWDGMKDRLGELQAKAPFNQPYGMREIHVIVPETKTLLFIGQVIA